ncbi:FtsK/SpoIIIE domain-containing protein [Demequina aestuarii]|uniref:FtsK/SpoIIIE domain-containing protein n=1 Tax=Demequina aestuarii TaxID=327095 RepID=UPI000A0767A0|nr:FtsK/SpoIIIE domain-containing protein [Demequina aestuarii]
MRFRARLERPTGDLEDIVVSAAPGATVQDLARSIVRDDPRREYDHESYRRDLALEVRATDGSHEVESFDARDTLEDLDIGSGVHLRVIPQEHAVRAEVGSLTIVAGPGHGTRLTLHQGTTTLGRGDDCDVTLADATVSKTHARIHATPGKVEIIDLNSANGVLLDDALVPRADITEGTPVTLGGTTLAVTMVNRPEEPGARVKGRDFTRMPRVELRFPTHELEGAALPVPSEKQSFPWLMVLMPMVVGLAVYAVTRSPLSLIFVAMSPAMMLGNWATGASRRRRQLKQAIEAFERQLERLSARLERERAEEILARHDEAPSLHDINTAALEIGEPLWTRRPEHWSFLFVRLGLGAAPSRVTVKEPEGRDRALPEYEERFDALVDDYRSVEDVPIVEDLAEAGALGIVGPSRYTAAYARGLLAQIAGLHAPTEVVVAGIMGQRWAAELEDLKWLPHAAAAEPVLGAPFGATPQGAIDVVSRLEEIIAQRTGGRDAPVPLGAIGPESAALRVGSQVGTKGSDSSGSTAPLPAIVVVIGDDAPIDRARLLQLMERAAMRGIYPVWLAHSRESLPATCRTFVSFDEQAIASASFVRLGTVIAPLQVEGFSDAHLAQFTRALARVRDASARSVDASDLPSTVTMLDLLGRNLATSGDAVVDRWSQNGSLVGPEGMPPAGYQPRLRALVGQAAQGALHIDLRGEGPHALVGGTTGAGKSEFLQAWVLGMAAEYSPQRVTFLFVDYKGGSAFADCTDLPHCVGLVTDLSPHLVRRALVSLRAELHYREELFQRKGAKDIIALEKRGDPECPPALVLVIDEFAALVSEVPDFVDGVVDIAQRGRSLGIHLIMATQRPAGVIKDNLRANTNLRVALRMADESDSMDVIGTKAAATFPPELPGRGALKSGPGRLTQFQSAYAGGRSFDAPPDVRPDVASFVFGPLVPWERPPSPTTATASASTPTDQQRLVATIVGGFRAARLRPPRRPWLDELPASIALEEIVGGSDARLPFGVVDIPQRQRQAPVTFDPDADQNLAIFGASGSGKTGTLRALAIAAGHVTEGAAHVYALDAGGSGLRMLEAMPHVGSVISGDDSERVTRLMRMLRGLVEDRTARYGAANASTLAEYRSLESQPHEPRVLLLVDNFPAFRADYEGVPGRADSYTSLQQVMQDGRAVGVHVVVTADRAAGISNAMQSTMQKRLVLRLADQDGYSALGAPRDVLNPESPAGRGVVAGMECQVAALGGLTNARELAERIVAIAPTLPSASRPAAEPVRALPAEYSLAEMPAAVDGQPVVGLTDVALAPHGFEPRGVMLVAGGPESGRSTALMSLAQSLRRWRRDMPLYYLGARRSQLRGWQGWTAAAGEAQELEGLDEAIERAVAGEHPIALVVESAADFADTPSDSRLQGWLRRARMGDLLIIAESDSSDFGGYGALKTELRSARRGMVLRPETPDGDAILKTSFPRVSRAEFGQGRGLWAASGRVARLQVPLPLPADDPSVQGERPDWLDGAGAPSANGDQAPVADAGAGPSASAQAAQATREQTAGTPASVPSWAVSPIRE